MVPDMTSFIPGSVRGNEQLLSIAKMTRPWVDELSGPESGAVYYYDDDGA